MQIEPGESLLLHAQADVNPDLDELERLELVVHGKVVAATNGPGRVEVEHRLIPAAGCWVAARAVGSNRSVAHSAPVYVTVGGAEHTWHAPSVPAIVDRMEALLQTSSRAHRISWSKTSSVGMSKPATTLDG